MEGGSKDRKACVSIHKDGEGEEEQAMGLCYRLVYLPDVLWR